MPPAPCRPMREERGDGPGARCRDRAQESAVRACWPASACKSGGSVPTPPKTSRNGMTITIGPISEKAWRRGSPGRHLAARLSAGDVRRLARVVGVGIETADMLVHEVLSRGTGSSNPSPSTRESDANLSFRVGTSSMPGNAAALVFFLFDLLHLDGEDLCPPIRRRTRRQKQQFRGSASLLRAIPVRSRHICGGGMIVAVSQRIRDATRSEGCTTTDYAVN